MANVIIYVSDTSLMPNGQKMLRGWLNMSNNYYTGGDTANFSNHFLSTSEPTVILGGSAQGYSFHCTPLSLASNCRIKSYFTVMNTSNVANANRALTEVTANTDLSAVNIGFMAVGLSY